MKADVRPPEPPPETCPVCGAVTSHWVYAEDGPFAGEWRDFGSKCEHDLPAPPRRTYEVRKLQEWCYGKPSLDTYADCNMNGVVAPANVVQAASEFLDGFDSKLRADRRGLLVYGAVGVGKSYLAAAIANELMVRQHRCYWARIEPLIAMGNEERRLAMAQLTAKQTALVVLDDFGTERGTSTGVAWTFNIVNDLYEAHACLLVTTNLTRSQIASQADEDDRRVLDRLKERCRCVEYEGPNKRQGNVLAM